MAVRRLMILNSPTKGPLPTTRETAVVMLADSIEAASRSLVAKNPENIRNLVENIFRQKGGIRSTRICSVDIQGYQGVKEAYFRKN